MVLDAKALTWAAKNNIDTPKLKAARVPIYGKWYFPEIPAGVALLNLETGEQQVFPERMVAGEVIYVPSADLIRAKLAPEGFSVTAVPAVVEEETTALSPLAPEPLLAMARPPGMRLGSELDLVPVEEQQPLMAQDAAALAGIHMPSPSIAPFIFAIGFCLALVGLITSVVILIVGLAWILAGAIVWIRLGMLEAQAVAAHNGGGEPG
jgi:hypothetical protein